MTLPQITELIDEKIEKNNQKVVISFYELKVKENLSDNDLRSTMNLISIRLSNLGYRVYTTGEKYNYNGLNYIVERNELIVAIK